MDFLQEAIRIVSSRMELLEKNKENYEESVFENVLDLGKMTVSQFEDCIEAQKNATIENREMLMEDVSNAFSNYGNFMRSSRSIRQSVSV